ncbi:MAG TPA: Smr/MutS family protein [Terriglobales bacterium]|nr:Smr/MutS family protein [Terriglobales bacterium]
MPTVSEALQQLDRELARARQSGCGVLKLIHGYGSSGAGGEIRIAAQRRLADMASRGEIRACIFGEDWAKSDERTWALINAWPDLKRDTDLGRRNQGITIVVL